VDAVARCIPALVVFLVSVVNTATAAAQTAQEEKKTFGASYADLSVEQRGLVDDLFRRAGSILGVTLALWGAYTVWLLVRNPEELTATENHPSWRHMYLMMMFAQVGFAVAYLL
jgi:hypothetical protein